jgi:hypothetical protein
MQPYNKACHFTHRNDWFDPGNHTLSGHNLRFFTLIPTLSQWEMELKEIAVYNRSKYKTGLKARAPGNDTGFVR